RKPVAHPLIAERTGAGRADAKARVLSGNPGQVLRRRVDLWWKGGRERHVLAGYDSRRVGGHDAIVIKGAGDKASDRCRYSHITGARAEQVCLRCRSIVGREAAGKV